MLADAARCWWWSPKCVKDYLLDIGLIITAEDFCNTNEVVAVIFERWTELLPYLTIALVNDDAAVLAPGKLPSKAPVRLETSRF